MELERCMEPLLGKQRPSRLRIDLVAWTFDAADGSSNRALGDPLIEVVASHVLVRCPAGLQVVDCR